MNKDLKNRILSDISEFRNGMIDNIRNLKLMDLNSNPLLGKMINTDCKNFIIKCINNKIHESEETKFGHLLEQILFTVAQENKFCRKSKFKGIDLELEINSNLLLFQIKSSEKWGNSSSTTAQGVFFEEAINKCKFDKKYKSIITVMGIICSNKKTTAGIRYTDYQIAGQTLFFLFSGNENTWKEICDLFSIGAEEFEHLRNKEFEEIVERLSMEFDKGMTWESLCKKRFENLDKENDILLDGLG